MREAGNRKRRPRGDGLQLDFVNHASLIVSHGGVRLLSDPWLQGTSFNDGWALLSPSAFGPEDFEGITHIWYSHEHPDHFSPRCLALCPEALRPGIEVLFHASEDTKIVRHCEGLGFRTRELPRDERSVPSQVTRFKCLPSSNSSH